MPHRPTDMYQHLATVLHRIRPVVRDNELAEDIAVEVVRRLVTGTGPAWLQQADEQTRLTVLTALEVMALPPVSRSTVPSTTTTAGTSGALPLGRSAPSSVRGQDLPLPATPGSDHAARATRWADLRHNRPRSGEPGRRMTGTGMTQADQLTPQQHAEAAASWLRDAPVPEPAHAQRLVLTLESLRGLSAVRRQVRAFLAAGVESGSPDEREGAVERAILVIDELTSNALRHGLPPCRLRVCDEPARWIVIVSDSAPDRHPAPARNRPAGDGGYGLYVIADLAGVHGVHYESREKLVWACLDKPGTDPASN